MKIVEQVKPTRLQQLMLAGQELNPDSPLYNMAFRFDLHGDLDCEKFLSAIHSVIENNDCLRMRLDIDNQLEILEKTEFRITLQDGDPGTDLDRRALVSLDTSHLCFDSALYRANEKHYIWYLNLHHIITDGAAFIELFRQLENTYLGNSFPRPCTFEKFQQSETKSLQSPEYLSASNFWNQRCEDRDTSTYSFETATRRQSIELRDDTMQLVTQGLMQAGIRSISRDLSMFSILAATLLILRYRVISNTETTLGAPFHSRRHTSFLGPEFEIGFIKIDINDYSNFLEVVQAVQQDTLLSMKNSLPGVSSARINNSFSWLLNYVSGYFGDFAGLHCQTSWLHPDAGDAAHALRLQAHDFNRSGRLTLHFDMATNRFTPTQRQRLPTIFERLLGHCLTDIHAPFAQHSLLDVNERSKLQAFNSTVSQPSALTVLDSFYQQLARSPDAVALSEEGTTSLSYSDLNKRANAVAEGLSGLPVIPLLIARSGDAVVAVLAALKSGRPFIPLDIQHPDERISRILDELGNPALLTTSDQKQRRLRCEKFVFVDKITALNATFEGPCSKIGDLAYIIFTSGTTGVPKGVEIGQRSFANYMGWATKTYTNGQAIDMPLYSSLAFDLTLTSIFLPLLTGGKIVVHTQAADTGQLEILDVFNNKQSDVIKLTPSHLRLVLRSLKNKKTSQTTQSRLKSLILGGEDLPRSLAIEAQERLSPDLVIYNEYGPTEATIGCMIHAFNAATDTSLSVPIGKPIDNSTVVLLDSCNQPTPTGFNGSMFLGGATLARGYHNGNKIEGKLYATGDIAMRLPDDNLVYCGRLGAQINFRGARIELEEIRKATLSFAPVDSATIKLSQQKKQQVEALCSDCGLSNSVPQVELDDNGLCNVCRDFASRKKHFQPYFKDLDQLKDNIASRLNGSATKDCLVLASGGKDSSYMLCKIVEMGFNPVVFTLDNGYLSEHALKNIERMTKRFSLTWVRDCPDAMTDIFTDSLKRHSNVCDGCFKTIYTLAINYALAHGIPSIVTGLSRGQLFETRLLDMVQADVYDEKEIDRRVSLARVAYHQINDAVAEHLDVSATQNPETFREITFFDFYRYCDVSLTTMLEFLEYYGGWKRPHDTGRSTNCLINDVGIYVHQQERKYHNYAIPYAWDVRLNHKTRLQAVDELNDDIDTAKVKNILADINYTPIEVPQENEQQLVAYYTLKTPVTDSAARLREHLSIHLPNYAMPTAFVELDEMPINVSGKIDQRALPEPTRRTRGYQAPRTRVEQILVSLWEKIFVEKKISINDNFFELGGDSITAVQLNMASNAVGIILSPSNIFNYPTIAELASNAKTETKPQSTNLYTPKSGLEAEELSELLARVSTRNNQQGSE